MAPEQSSLGKLARELLKIAESCIRYSGNRNEEKKSLVYYTANWKQNNNY